MPALDPENRPEWDRCFGKITKIINYLQANPDCDLSIDGVTRPFLQTFEFWNRQPAVVASLIYNIITKGNPVAKRKTSSFGKKQTVITVEYGELEELATKVYNLKDYSFVATEECGNDSTHSFTVKNVVGKFDEKEANQIRNGEVGMYNNGLLLNVLCTDGYIEPGEYIVEVCW